jgi:hypothetical protein
LRVEREQRPALSLRSEVERLSKLNAELRTENALLGDRLARVVGTLRDVDLETSAVDVLRRVRVELAK